jgi:hypothetical protein
VQQPTMLYKCPGPHPIHGGFYDTTIVDASEIDKALSEGWYLTTPDAKAAHEAQQAAAATLVADNAAPTREELLQKAVELGLEVNPAWGDKRLGAEIAKKLKA